MFRYSLLAGALAFFLLCACGNDNREPFGAPSYPQKAVSLVAPAGSGSGYDLTIRSIADCLKDNGLVLVPLPVTNIPGDGGATALEFLDSNRGDGYVLSVFSPPLNLTYLNGSTEMNYRDNTTPIARLIVDYGIFAVRKDSPYQTLGQVMDVLRENPEAIRLGGVSAYGSMDHIQFLKVAHAAGVESLNRISYTGYQDGTAVSQLLGGHVDMISTGIGDTIGLLESGDIRALAITAENRVGEGLISRIPTCKEQGVDAAFISWRGIFGPKNMPEYALVYWEETLAKMVKTESWGKFCAEYNWGMAYAGHDEFLTFLDEMDKEYKELLKEIGFAAEE